MTTPEKLHLISEPNRWRIVVEIYSNPSGITPTIIAAKLGLPLDSVSHHLNRLQETGLISFLRSGSNRLYRPLPQAWDSLIGELLLLTKDY